MVETGCHIAQALSYRGDFVASEALLKTLDSRCCDSYGEEISGRSPRLMVTQTLGAVYHDEGRLEEALALKKTSFEAMLGCSQHAGPDHLQTIKAKVELATVYQAMGAHDKALAIFNEAIASGAGFTETDQFTLFGNVACSHMALKNYAVAIRYGQDAADGFRQTFGAAHPETLLAVGSLGSMLSASGQHAAAAIQLEVAVAGYTGMYGAAHPQAVVYRNALEYNLAVLEDPSLKTDAARLPAPGGLIFLNPHAKKTAATAGGADTDAPSVTETVSARVVMVVSRPELNGSDVQVVRFLESKERYEVIASVAAGRKAKLTLKPSNLVWSVGTAVLVVGMKQQPEMNGLHGAVEGFDAQKGRYVVRLPARPRPASLRPENCRACLPPVAAG